MAKAPGTPMPRTGGSTPEHVPAASPGEAFNQHSFYLQSIADLQRSFGRVEKAVEVLEKSSEKQTVAIEAQGKTIGEIKRTIYAAGAVVAVIATIFGFVVTHDYQKLAKLIQPAPEAASH